MAKRFAYRLVAVVCLTVFTLAGGAAQASAYWHVGLAHGEIGSPDPNDW